MRILIVDDDYISRLRLKSLLQKYGDCDAASDGDLAIAMYKSALKEDMPYHLVTMDVEMPDMRGQDVVHKLMEIQKDSADPEHSFKVFMISGKKNMQDVASSYFEGCEEYILKPVTPDKIAEAIKKHDLLDA
jgi:two-component system chemotaxis response regulator CheY